MHFGYVTTDDLNLDLATRLAEDCEIELYSLSPQEAVPQESLDAMLYDWDYVPPDLRREVLSRLVTRQFPYPVALHSYNLDAKQVRALRRHGVIVYPRLNATVFRLLQYQVRQASNLGLVPGA
jgi:hypothetical protein